MLQASAAIAKRRREAARYVLEDSSDGPDTENLSMDRNADVSKDVEDHDMTDEMSTESVLEDDDPQVDWRTTQDQWGLAEQEEDNHPIAGPTPSRLPCELPTRIREIETSHFRPRSSRLGGERIHEIYTDFLTGLCEETDTQFSEGYVLDGLKRVVEIAQSIHLDQALTDELLLYAFALIVHVWQVVCLRATHDSYPDIGLSLSLECSSYFLSAHAIVATKFEDRVDLPRFRFAVQHWEERMFDLGDRDVWIKSEWLRNIGEHTFSSRDPRNDIARVYLRALKDGGKFGLAGKIYKEALEGPMTPLRKTVNHERQDQRTWAISSIFGILNGMEDELLEALIDGRLSQEAEVNSGAVWSALKRINRPDITRPSIYMNSICDHMGISPSPAQWLIVCEQMQAYTTSEGNEMAATVDQLIPSQKWPREVAMKYPNLRRYTEWRSFLNNKDKHPNRPRRDMVRYFVSQMRGRIQNQAKHVPLDAPVIEIGYSLDSHKRLKQHASHQNSNYLMNLAQVMFEHLFPGSFRLQQRIIFNCYSKEQTWLGEVILTQLGQGYTEGAGGFSHFPAGHSNGSAYRTTPSIDWDRYEVEAFADGRMERDLDREIAEVEKRREARKKTAEWKRKRISAYMEALDAMIALKKGIQEAEASGS